MGKERQPKAKKEPRKWPTQKEVDEAVRIGELELAQMHLERIKDTIPHDGKIIVINL